MNHDKILEGIAEGREESGQIVTHYFVVATVMGVNDDGTPDISTVAEAMEGTGLSSALGLLEFAKIMVTQDIMEAPERE